MQIFWALAVFVAAVAFGASTFIVPDFGGFDPNAFPIPQDRPPVQPAGYAFAIWGVIYVWLVLGAGFGLLRRSDALDWAEMRPPLALSLAVGATWLVAAKASPLAATVLIWVMLAGALVALFRAPLLDRWWGQAPIGIYAGWLSAASCVALGLVLAGYGLFSPERAAFICILLAIVGGGVIQVLLDGVPEYGLTIVWALFAILMANIPGPPDVVFLTLAGLVVTLLLALRAIGR